MEKLGLIGVVLLLVAVPSVCASDPGGDPDVASAWEHRVQSAAFIRHNCGIHAWMAGAGTEKAVRFRIGARNADFWRHNYGTDFYSMTSTPTEVKTGLTERCSSAGDFARHNCHGARLETPTVAPWRRR
jgi:hypothetical protein